MPAEPKKRRQRLCFHNCCRLGHFATGSGLVFYIEPPPRPSTRERESFIPRLCRMVIRCRDDNSILTDGKLFVKRESHRLNLSKSYQAERKKELGVATSARQESAIKRQLRISTLVR